MNETYSEEFVKSLRRFSSIKKRIVNKIDKIIQDPLMGELLNPDFSITKSAHRAAASLLCCEKLIIEKESEKPLYFIIKNMMMGQD